MRRINFVLIEISLASFSNEQCRPEAKILVYRAAFFLLEVCFEVSNSMPKKMTGLLKKAQMTKLGLNFEN